MSGTKTPFDVWPNPRAVEDQRAFEKHIESAMAQEQLRTRLEAEKQYAGERLPRISKSAVTWYTEEPGNILTPVKKPCKFLGMATKNSPTTGIPSGVTQSCCHPVHGELRLLQQNVREILQYIHKFIYDWDNRNDAIASAMTNLVIRANAAALDLPNPKDYIPEQAVLQVSELRQYYQELSERLHQSEQTTKDVSDIKEFTD